MAKDPKTGAKHPPAEDLPPKEKVNPPRTGPHPQKRPDERKEGGPDFGQEREQWEKAAEEARDTTRPRPAPHKE